jgi:lysyl-tRNA synthetase class 2
MKLIIDDKVFRKFPKLNIGLLKIKSMDNSGSSKDSDKLLKEIEEYCRETYVLKNLSSLPTLTNWKSIYKFDRKTYSAMEPLLYDILRGKSVARNNNLVNLYTYQMLKSMLPIAGDDLDKVDGNIKLKIAEGYETLMTGKIIDHPEEGELCYVDDKEVLSRRFGWEQCDKTKITHYTKKAVLYLDALPPIEIEDLKAVMIELKDLISTFCKAEVLMAILNKDKTETVL